MSEFRRLMMAAQGGVPSGDIVLDIETTADSLTYGIWSSSSYTADWGDGTTTTGVTEHTYSTAGTYRIVIADASGVLQIRFGNDSYGQMVKKIWHCKLPNISTPNLAFRYLSNITSLPADFVVADTITNISYMCAGCTNLVSLGGFAIPAALTNAYKAFEGCVSLAALPPFPAAFSASSISMGHAFYGCSAMTGTAPAALLWEDTSKTWSTGYVFYGCTSLTNYADIPSGWK